MEITPVENKLCCRKCGGPHFTIKCGKDKVVEPVKEIKEEVKVEKVVVFNDFKEDNKDKEKKYYRKIFRVKVSDLPVDMTEEEMMELTQNWGSISKIKVLNYDSNSTAYIDFAYKDMADYFIQALDRTPFESLLIGVSHADSY
jgi:hypothetical protein